MFSNKYQKGFTLIDVLIATAIVSILSSVFLFGISEAKKKSEDGKMIAESQQVSSAIAMYKNDNNGHPPLTAKNQYVEPRLGVIHSEGDPDSDYLSTMQTLVDGGYLPEVPRSPSGSSYSYGVDSNDNATFGVKLNRTIPVNSDRNSCPASLSVAETESSYPVNYNQYQFGVCELDFGCDAGQITDTTTCFGVKYQDIVNYCQCSGGGGAVKPEYQGTFPNNLCQRYVSCTDSFTAIPTPPPKEFLYNSLIKTAYAQTTMIIQNFNLTYYSCYHNPVPAVTPDNSNISLCNGTNDDEYCQCL